jgi:cell division septum initiation protein DivIVA
MLTKILKTIPVKHFLVATIICILSSSSGSLAEEAATQKAIQSYQKNRLDFINQQKSSSQSFQNKTTSLKQEIDRLNQEIAKNRQELDKLETAIAENNQTAKELSAIQSGISFALFPLLSAFSFLSTFWGEFVGLFILYFFLSLAIINTFLYLYWKERLFFTRYKLALILASAALICSIASPLLADDLSKRAEVITQLNNTEKVLSLSDHERFIAILEARTNHTIDIPDLPSGDPLFRVFRQVALDTPEYWFTLAALYTHEGKNGKALDAIKQLTQNSRLDTTEAHRRMVLNSITYLLQQNQTELASAVIDSLSENLLDVSSLLDLARLLQKNGMQVSSEKVLGYSVNRADTVPDLIKLSTFLIENGKLDKGNEAMEKALTRADTIDDLILVAETAMSLNKDAIIARLTQKAGSVIGNYRDQTRIIDLFLKNGRKEEAVMLFKNMIDNVSPRTENSTEKLLFLIEAALQRGLLPQATSATERLYFYLGTDSESFAMQLQTKLKAAEGIPDEDMIMLPQFYGLLNEEQGINDQAEAAYIKAVLASLTNILRSYGYELPQSLNNFYLLGRLWVKDNRGDLISQLDRVYSIIEKQFIKQQMQQNNRKLDEMQNEIKSLQASKEKLLKEIKEKKRHVSASWRKKIEHLVSTLATALFVLAAFSGCLILSHRYSKTLALYKTYGFFGKFIETSGWLQVLSVLGCISGIAQVVLGQFLQIFGQNQENTRKLSLHLATADKAQEPQS